MKNNFFKKGHFSHGVLNLTPSESYGMTDRGALIVDLREEYLTSYKMFNVPDVIYIPFSQLRDSYGQLPDNVPLIMADSVGLRSREGVVFMTEHGYENVANMAGGIVDWERDGLPLTTDINYRLSGSCMCQLRAREGGSG